MPLHLALFLLPLVPLAAAAEGIDDLAVYSAPENWAVERDTVSADPKTRWTFGRHVLTVKLLGGPGSRYASPAEYLDGFEARTLGAPAVRVGTATAAGAPLYEHRYPIDLGDPHEASPAAPVLAREEFCLVPAGKRFFALSYAYEAVIPDPRMDGGAFWRQFLKGFSLKKRPPQLRTGPPPAQKKP